MTERIAINDLQFFAGILDHVAAALGAVPACADLHDPGAACRVITLNNIIECKLSYYEFHLRHFRITSLFIYHTAIISQLRLIVKAYFGFFCFIIVSGFNHVCTSGNLLRYWSVALTF